MRLNTITDSINSEIYVHTHETSSITSEVSANVNTLIQTVPYKFLIQKPTDLSKEELRYLAHATAHGFGMDMDESDVISHILDCDKIGCVFSGDIPIGFASLKIFDQNGYLYGTALHPDHQRSGIMKKLYTCLFDNYECIFFRTQNHGLIKSIESLGRKVSLGRDALKEIQNLENKECLKMIDFNILDDGIFKAAYGNFLGNPTKHRFVTSDVYPNFHAEQGDALLVATFPTVNK